MRRCGHLFEHVVALDNLRLADDNARIGKKSRYGITLHDKHRDAHLRALHDMLVNGTYKTSSYGVFTIHEPKEREIYRLPYYPDRIVHHAIMNVVEPLWVSSFTTDTYSCIKQRGIHACARNVKKALRVDSVGTSYCLKLDIRKFYQSINHRILKRILRRKIKDARLLALLDEIIDSVERGVPIGNYLSQFFANLYLAYFDHYVKEVLHVKHYFRYADDIVLFAETKEELHVVLRDVRKYLHDELQLGVKRNYQIFCVDERGVDFVGYRFYHTHTLLRKTIKQSLCRKVATINKRKRQLSMKAYKQQIASWWGWCKYCNARNLFNKLSKTFPYDLQFDRHCA